WFTVRATNSPVLIQAQAVDLDLDSWTDIVGLSETRKPVLLRNYHGQLVHAPEGLGRDEDWPADLIAVMVGDFDCDGLPDLVCWSESKGLELRVNQGNGNHGLKLELKGHRRVDVENGGRSVRTNADGFGTRVMAQVKDLWTGGEYTTLATGLG